jgi:hypothetical protein
MIRSERAKAFRAGHPPPKNKHMAHVHAVQDCPHRSQPETCGCTAGLALCAAGKREFDSDERVSFGFCLRCVAS